MPAVTARDEKGPQKSRQDRLCSCPARLPGKGALRIEGARREALDTTAQANSACQSLIAHFRVEQYKSNQEHASAHGMWQARTTQARPET
jgi:hypothetical protein